MCESKRHFSCHDAPALRQPPQVFHSHGHCLLGAQGSCGRPRERQPTFPTFHLSAVPFVPTREAGMKGETLEREGNSSHPPPLLPLPRPPTPESQSILSCLRAVWDYASFLGENPGERGGIGHESSHNPRWRAKALAFKRKTAWVT